MRPRLYAFDPEYEPPYPTIKRLGPGYIGMTEEFIIPDADREMVLQKLYPFVDPPRLGTRKSSTGGSVKPCHRRRSRGRRCRDAG
jgi:hypothetical protein